MFSPYKASNWLDRVLSVYISNVPLNSGALVDIDTSDPIGISATAKVGFNGLRAGSLKLATVAAADTTHFGKELGLSVPGVTIGAPTLSDFILQQANVLLTVPAGSAVGVLKLIPGDLIATTEYVGFLPGDSGATGALDITDNTKCGAPLGIFQGRFRLAQSGDAIRARFLFNTDLNGNQAPVVEMA